MTHTTDIFALGMKFEVDDGASNAFAEVLNCRMINWPKSEVKEIEADFLNMGTVIERALAGMVNPGEVAFEYEFAEDTYARLHALLRVTHNWRISIFDQTNISSPVLQMKVTFAGFLKMHEGPDVDSPNKLLVCKGTVRRTSDLTIATS